MSLPESVFLLEVLQHKDLSLRNAACSVHCVRFEPERFLCTLLSLLPDGHPVSQGHASSARGCSQASGNFEVRILCKVTQFDLP